MPDEKETGKHPHKSTEEPYPHHEAGRSGEQRSSGSEHSNRGGEQRSGSSSEKEGLKQREYKDNQGEVHHHTRTFEEQHKK